MHLPGWGSPSKACYPEPARSKLAWEAIELVLGRFRDSNGARSTATSFQPGFWGRYIGRGSESSWTRGAGKHCKINSSGASGIFALIAAIGMIEGRHSRVRHMRDMPQMRAPRQSRFGAGRNTTRAKTQTLSTACFSPGAQAALMAQGYLHKYGRSSADLAELAVALRSNAVPRNDAYMSGRPITV